MKKSMLFKAAQSVEGIKECEELIKSKFDSQSELLFKIPTYLFDLGGKRIRPVLTLLSGKASGQSPLKTELIQVAAGIELIHMATLLHDDIIDKSPVRRHEVSAYLKYGVPATLLAGDFLLVRAFSLCAHLDRFIVNATEQACVELTEGEIDEIPLNQGHLELSQGIEIARKKTAALFKLGGLSAAFLSDLPGSGIQAMGEFGESLGIAFQILDDILDVTSNEDTLGKRAGQDIRERKPSIVNLLWQRSPSILAQSLCKTPENEEHEDQFVREALRELNDDSRSNVVAEAKALAIGYADNAREALNAALSQANSYDPRAKSRLEELVDYTVARLN